MIFDESKSLMTAPIDCSAISPTQELPRSRCEWPCRAMMEA